MGMQFYVFSQSSGKCLGYLFNQSFPIYAIPIPLILMITFLILISSLFNTLSLKTGWRVCELDGSHNSMKLVAGRARIKS